MNDHDDIFRLLDGQGWAVSDTVVPLSWQITLLMQGWQLWEDGYFHPEGVGRAGDAQRPNIRGDTVCWIPPESSQAQHPFFKWMAQFRQELSQRYDLGLRSQEFHFARYGAGTGYVKHIDQHRDSDHRKISIVLYLNLQWNPMHGGELCLYQPDDPNAEMRRITPVGARLVVFHSGLVPHAVLPCRQTRWSVTGWLRSDEIPE